MKNFGLMVGLAAAVTVGGVYATWTYAGANANVENNGSVSLEIGGSTATNSKGDLKANGTIILKIDDTNNDYKAELSGSGEISVTFTPATGASVDSINVQYALVVNGGSYTLPNGTEEKYFEDLNTTVDFGSVGSTAATLTADDLISKLAFNEETLPTQEDYDAYSGSFSSISITVTFSEKA